MKTKEKCGLCGGEVLVNYLEDGLLDTSKENKCGSCGALKYQIREKWDPIKKLPDSIIQGVLELQQMDEEESRGVDINE